MIMTNMTSKAQAANLDMATGGLLMRNWKDGSYKWSENNLKAKLRQFWLAYTNLMTVEDLVCLLEKAAEALLCIWHRMYLCLVSRSLVSVTGHESCSRIMTQ